MKFSIGSALAAATLSLAISAPALAKDAYSAPSTTIGSSSIDINLAGWQSFGGFGRPTNSQVFLDVGAGSVITGFQYIGLSYNTENGSWLSELTLSVNNTDGSAFFDWAPSTTDSSGSFGPESGAWGGLTGGPGPFGAGGEFTVADGTLWITVYEGFDDPFGDTGLLADATITAGTLRVFLAPVPEPGTYGMMALGLLAVGAVMRKRQQSH
jgi:PEP-CTERM motif